MPFLLVSTLIILVTALFARVLFSKVLTRAFFKEAVQWRAIFKIEVATLGVSLVFGVLAILVLALTPSPINEFLSVIFAVLSVMAALYIYIKKFKNKLPNKSRWAIFGMYLLRGFLSVIIIMICAVVIRTTHLTNLLF